MRIISSSAGKTTTNRTQSYKISKTSNFDNLQIGTQEFLYSITDLIGVTKALSIRCFNRVISQLAACLWWLCKNARKWKLTDYRIKKCYCKLWVICVLEHVMVFMFTLVQHLKKIYNSIYQYLASTMALQATAVLCKSGVLKLENQ